MRNLGIFVVATVLLWVGSDVGQCRESTVKASPPSERWKSRGQGAESGIRTFVRQLYIHGVPYEKAIKYDASVVPLLLEMLNDPAEQDYWSNIVVTLGDHRG